MSTLGLEPELFLLTTGTFNLVVKDRRRFPPEQGVFSPTKSFRANADARTLWNLAVLETLKLLVLLLSCQPIAATGFPPVFHMGNSAIRFAIGSFSSAQQNASSDSPCRAPAPGSTRACFGTSRIGRFLVRKRTFGGFCENR